MNLFLQRACVWFRLYVRSCSVRHYSARSYVCALTNTHTESVSFQCFLVCFVQLWGVVTVKNNNKIIKNLMSSQHHCSKYTKKKLVCMKIMEKNCISTLLVFFFFFFFASQSSLTKTNFCSLVFFYVSVHIHSVKNDIFHFCESAKN